MKKIGLLAALATLITVGGVYATWQYSSGQVQDASGNPSFVMADATVTPTDYSTITVTNTLQYSVDDTNDDKKAELVLVSGTACNVSYKLTKDLSEVDEKDTIATSLTVTLTCNNPGAWDHDNDANTAAIPFFTCAASSSVDLLTIDVSSIETKNETIDTVITTQVTSKLQELFNVQTLETHAKYISYKTALEGASTKPQFTITVSPNISA